MLPFRLVYDPLYDLRLGPHVFPSQKYRLLHDRLLHTHFCTDEDFIAPEPATDEDLLLVHEPQWVDKLRNGTLTYDEILKLEIPYSSDTMKAFLMGTGGTILAARLALQARFGFNLSGGFHHAFPGHGEGFCPINDIGVAVRRLQKDGDIRRAMIVDCDVHHGNGTAGVFASDRSVFTLSIHQFNNYPREKPLSSMDIHLADNTGDEEYLKRLRNGLAGALSMFRPDLLIYVAGADPYHADQLGGLALTFRGLMERDRLVIGTAVHEKISLATVLAGGYAENVEDTITIHANTAVVALEVLAGGQAMAS